MALWATHGHDNHCYSGLIFNGAEGFTPLKNVAKSTRPSGPGCFSYRDLQKT